VGGPTWIADGVQLAFAGEPGFLGVLDGFGCAIGLAAGRGYLEQLVYARHGGWWTGADVM